MEGKAQYSTMLPRGAYKAAVTGLVLAGSLLLQACQAPPPEGVARPTIAPIAHEVAATAPAGLQRYLISPGDQLDIRFPYRPDFNTTQTVRPDGVISAVLVGSVPVAGLSPEQATQRLQADYAALARRVPPPTKRSYLIQSGDVLDIRFTDAKDLNDQALVRPDGRISLTMVGSFIAEGKTPERLTRDLRAAYAKQITSPDLVVIVRRIANSQFVANGQVENVPIGGLENVAVVVRGFPAPRVYVGGEVQRPGEQPFSGHVSLLQAVLSAGGATSSGELRSVVVVRRDADGKPIIFIVNVKHDLQGQLASDIPLQPFDVVYVPKTEIAKAQDFLEQYLYRLIPALRNSSIGFTYVATSTISR